MTRTFSRMLLGAALVLVCQATAAWAQYAVPGGYQSAGGYGTDWTPGNAPYLNPLGGNVYDLSLAGLSPGAYYEFKILDDGGTPPANWGDPELPNGNNQWFLASAGGTAKLTFDRNTYNDGFLPATDRLIISTDGDFATFYATGNWMTEAGGGGDWNNADPAFQLSDVGAGLWTKDIVVSTPGTYEYKVTHNGWTNQWGANGRSGNASTLLFTTTYAGQPVSLQLDLSKGAIGALVVPEPASIVFVGLALAMAGAVRRRK